MSCNQTVTHGEPNIERLLWLTAKFVAENLKEKEKEAKDGKHDCSGGNGADDAVRRG